MLIFLCRHFVSDPPEERGPHEEQMPVEVDEAALLLVNLYGLLLPHDHPGRQWQATTYGEDEVRRREGIARQHILPVLRAARGAGIPVIYVSDSAPNIALERSNIREVMTRHLSVDPLEAFAEPGNDPHEYLRGASGHITYAPELAPQTSDYYVRKWVYSGFYGTWLDRLLRNLRTRVLFCAGFNGDSDLWCTMLDGHWAGYRMVLLRECYAAVHISEYEPEMDFTRRLILYAETCLGFTTSATDFIAACHSDGKGRS